MFLKTNKHQKRKFDRQNQSNKNGIPTFGSRIMQQVIFFLYAVGISLHSISVWGALILPARNDCYFFFSFVFFRCRKTREKKNILPRMVFGTRNDLIKKKNNNHKMFSMIIKHAFDFKFGVNSFFSHYYNIFKKKVKNVQHSNRLSRTNVLFRCCVVSIADNSVFFIEVSH